MNKPVPPQRPKSKGNGSLLRYMQKLWDYIVTLTVKGDGKYITVDRTSMGFMVKLNYNALEIPHPGGGAGGGSSEDTGYFTAKNTSTTTDGTRIFKIKIIDSDNEDSDTCGKAFTNILHTLDMQEFSVTASGVIALKAYYNESAWTVTLEQMTSTPSTFPENTIYADICSYTLENNKLTISQSWKNGIYYFNWGHWV